MERTRPIPTYLAKRLAGWRATEFSQNKGWYAQLAARGQAPRAMFISCCDSRLDPLTMFAGEPGDFFLVRNVANLVPPFTVDHDHHGTSAAIEYAVTALKVAHIVVLGHSHCGGVAACHDMCAGTAPELERDGSFIGRWMDILRPGYTRIEGMDGSRDDRLRALEHEGVRQSLRNLLTFPFVTEAIANDMLSIHGLWTDIASGEVLEYHHGPDLFERM